METEKGPLKKEQQLQTINFLGSMLVFGGVSEIFFNTTHPNKTMIAR